MFRIKVCGLTSPEDAALAVEAGADAVGINFFPKSPRYVSPRTATPIVRAVGRGATVVGVFVDEAPEKIAGVCGDLGIGMVQLSGREPPEIAARLPLPVIKAVHGERGVSLEALRDYPCIAFLLDAAVPGRFGGTGMSLDWNVLAQVFGGPFVRIGGTGSDRPWLLAGGLTPENVAEAIRTAHPFGVDVASGVEASPGKKDPGKVRGFVANAKEGFGIAKAGG